MSQQEKINPLKRGNDFFLKNYKPFHQDISREPNKDFDSVQLECLGYGIFQPKVLLDNFIEYTIQALNYFRKSNTFKILKIVLNGFTLDPADPILQRLARQIPKAKENLHTLWIHTSNLKGVTLKDFNELLRLSHHLSDINFENFSLQCANWSFTPHQPSFRDLRKIFESLIQQSTDITRLMNTHFRLEMSGWYYTLPEARAFLGLKLPETQLKKLPENQRAKYSEGLQYSDEVFFKELQKFFMDMQRLLKQLLNVMDNITNLQLDMRNSHEVLKLKNLKKRLDNVTKENRIEKSLISKRTEIKADDSEKELKLNIVM